MFDKETYKEGVKKRYEWINSLVEISEFPEMRLASTIRGKDGYWHPGQRIFLKEYKNMRMFIPDYYTVRAWEVPFEQDSLWDHPVYGVKVLAKKTVEALISLDIPFKIYDSAGRGLHTHVYFKPPDNKELLQTAEKKGMMPRDLRFLVFKMVNDQAKISEEYRGVISDKHNGNPVFVPGKPQDATCINFDDTTGMGRLIRCNGGRKIDKEGRLIGYKTLIDIIPEHKTLIKKFTDVIYPDKNEIKIWTIPEVIFKNYVEDFKPPQKPKTQTSLKEYKGELLNTPCALTLRLNGAPPGQRSLSAKALAVFCVGDGLDYYEGLDVLTEYYNHCDTTDFDIGEVKQWCKWAYDKVVEKPEDYIHCGHMRTMGICDKEHCEYYKKSRKKYETKKTHDDSRNPTWLAPHQQPPKVRWMKTKKIKGKQSSRRKRMIRW